MPRGLAARGVVTSTLGIGDGYDEALLAGIAEQGGGRMHDAEHAGDIATVLLGELDEAGAALAEGLVVTLDLPAGMDAEVLGQTAVTAQGRRLTVRMGAMGAGIPRSLVLRLTCPKGAPGDVLPIAVTARATADGATLTATADTALTLARGRDNDTQTRDAGLAAQVAARWHAHVLREAATLNRDGAPEAAQAYLDEQIRLFAAYAEGLPGAGDWRAGLRLLREQSGRRWSERARKEVRFFAYRMSAEAPDMLAETREAWTARLERDGRGG
jgi:Ca-activated chloride channel homolog